MNATRGWLEGRPGAVRRAALRYAAHGWPVLPGTFADPARGTHTCERVRCMARGTHPAVLDWSAAATIDCLRISEWWARGRYAIVLPTGVVFDVLEVPGDFGSAVRPVFLGGTDRPTGPVAVAPNGRWYVLVGPGAALRADLAERVGVMLHGTGSWMLAPPSPLPTGRMRWVVPPDAVGWRPADGGAVQDALASFVRRHTP